MATLQPLLIVGIVFFSIIEFIRILSDNRIRHKLIDKGMVDDNVRFLYQAKENGKNPSSLKWGIVLFAIGTALVLGQLFPDSIEEEMMIAFMFLFSGGGLILYYTFAGMKTNKGE